MGEKAINEFLAMIVEEIDRTGWDKVSRANLYRLSEFYLEMLDKGFPPARCAKLAKMSLNCT